MKLIELKQYNQNKFDKELIIRMTKDSEENLNKYIVSVICDLLQHIPLDESLKINAKNNINSNDEKNIGEISTYVSLIPYLQLKLKDTNDGYIISSSYVERLISYLVGYMDEQEFNQKTCDMIKTLEISDKLYNGLVSYFALNKEKIVNGINQRLK